MTQFSNDISGPAAASAVPERSKWLTFAYALAMISVVGATVLTIAMMYALATLWHGKATLGVILGVSSSQVAGGVSLAVTAVLLAVAAFFLFGRVSKEAATDRSGFTKGIGYKLVTYSGLGALVLCVVPQVATLIGVLISSLLLIGVKDAGTVYGMMYITSFLPALVSLGLLAAAIFCVGKIVIGFNKSRLLSIILIAATAVILVATAITLAVKAHSTKSTFDRLDLNNLGNSLFRSVR